MNLYSNVKLRQCSFLVTSLLKLYIVNVNTDSLEQESQNHGVSAFIQMCGVAP